MSSTAGKDEPAVERGPGAHAARTDQLRSGADPVGIAPGDFDEADDADDADDELDLTFSDDNVLIDAHEDRWRWRRTIRQDPRKLIVYRFAVGVAGVFFIALGFVTGPLPGPGGIPLVLLGLAILASEFEWAHRLMQYFKAQLHRFQRWTRLQQVLFWCVFFAACGALGYTYMLIFGVPGWVPHFVERHLNLLPGL